MKFKPPVFTSVLLAFTALSAAIPQLPAASPAGNTPDSRPNIIFLFSDDQTALAAGCYGNPEIHTPHLDKLARDGVRFAKKGFRNHARV